MARSILVGAVAVLLLGTVLAAGLSVVPKHKEERSSSSSSFISPLKVQARYLNGRYSLESIIELKMGTPSQSVPFFFDTGSYWPSVYNQSCSTPDCGIAPSRYNSAESTTSIVSSVSADSSYAAGSVDGVYAQDYISFHSIFSSEGSSRTKEMMGSSLSSNIATLPPRYFANFSLIDKVYWESSQNLGLYNSSGVFGMGPPNIGPYPASTKFLLNHSVGSASVWLPRGAPFNHGIVQFNAVGANTKNAAPGFTWASLNGATSWTVLIDDVLVNGESTGVCVNTRKTNSSGSAVCYTIFDTGGSVMDFTGAGLPHFPKNLPCNETSGMLPNISLVISGETFTLEPRDYVLNLGEVEKNPKKLNECQSCINTEGIAADSAAEGSNDHQFFSRKMKRSKEIQTSLKKYLKLEGNDSVGYQELDLGVMWTSRVTTTFDFENLRIGFKQHE